MVLCRKNLYISIFVVSVSYFDAKAAILKSWLYPMKSERCSTRSSVFTSSGCNDLVKSWYDSSKSNLDLEKRYAYLETKNQQIQESIQSSKRLQLQHLKDQQDIEAKVNQILIDKSSRDKRFRERLLKLSQSYAQSDDTFQRRWAHDIKSNFGNGQSNRRQGIWKKFKKCISNSMDFACWKPVKQIDIPSHQTVYDWLMKHMEYLYNIYLRLNFSKEKEIKLQEMLKDERLRAQYSDPSDLSFLFEDSTPTSACTANIGEDESIQKQFEILRDEEKLHYFLLAYMDRTRDRIRDVILGQTSSPEEDKIRSMIQEDPESLSIIPMKYLTEGQSQKLCDLELSGLKANIVSVENDHLEGFHRENDSKAWKSLGKFQSSKHSISCQNHPADVSSLKGFEVLIQDKNVIPKSIPGDKGFKIVEQKLFNVPMDLNPMEQSVPFFDLILQDKQDWRNGKSNIDLGRLAIQLDDGNTYGKLQRYELELLGDTFKEEVWDKLSTKEKGWYVLQNKDNCIPDDVNMLKEMSKDNVMSLRDKWIKMNFLESKRYPKEIEWCLEVLNHAETQGLNLNQTYQKMKIDLASQPSKWSSNMCKFRSMRSAFEDSMTQRFGIKKCDLEKVIKLTGLMVLGTSEFQRIILISKMKKKHVKMLIQFYDILPQKRHKNFHKLKEHVHWIIAHTKLRLEVSQNPVQLDISKNHHSQFINDQVLWKYFESTTFSKVQKNYRFLKHFLKNLTFDSEVLNSFDPPKKFPKISVSDQDKFLMF